MDQARPFASVGRAWTLILECALTTKSTYVDYWLMPRKPNNSRQTRALLAALLDRPHTWRHGYDLAKETGLKSGTLYPLLMRLSEQGLLESCWQEAKRPGLPPRHVYRLTASGLALAREQELAAITAERAGALA
jgi:PadR family transcriptional regulator, regulatory protein PadR